MFFRHYFNAISNATRGLAKAIFTTGLLLTGFGALILIFPEVFATLIAAIFIFIGVGCCVTAIRIFFSTRNIRDYSDLDEDYRENVHIHFDRHFEQ